MIDVLSGEGTVRKELPAKFIQFARHGIDISKEPMLVYPTLHYQNGGTAINANTETVIPGLYSAGECTGRPPWREPPHGQQPPGCDHLWPSSGYLRG
jgi:succinate dehydrogenase/fumarate reductase flavoprotein subunit